MEIHLTPEQSDFVRHAVATGRINDPEQAMQEAMALWVERERHRAAFVKSLDEAEASLARGEGITIWDEADAAAFFDDIKTRGRARLEAKNGASFPQETT